MSITPEQYLLYLQYLLCGVAMTVLFAALYLKLTPVDELAQIKTGNAACALSLGGTLLGFCLPLASSIAHSVGFFDFVLWGSGAALVQILVYLAVTRIIPNANTELEENNIGVGILFAAISLSIGLLNAACLS